MKVDIYLKESTKVKHISNKTIVTIKQCRQSYTTIKIYIIMKVAFLHEKKSLHDLLLN